MFSLFNKKKSHNIDFSIIGTDMHSHLLPGIDDGSPDTEISTRLIKGLMDLGYKKFITTPHVMQDLYLNSPATIHSAHDFLKESLQTFSVDIRPAAEYFMDNYFDQLLEKNEPLLTLKDNLVLVEFSFVNPPINVQETLFQMQIKGYQPVLAHPERYTYLLRNKAFYDTLKNAGCLFQLNLLSLTNYYGKEAADLASYLINKDYINIVGTDLHHERHLEALRNYPSAAFTTIQRMADRGKIMNASW